NASIIKNMEKILNRKVSIQLTDSCNRTWSFEVLREFYDFVVKECDYWKSQRDSLGTKSNNINNYLNAHSYLNNIITTIDGWGDKLNEWDESQFTSQIGQIRNNHFNNLRNHWLWSGHPFSSALVDCHRKYGHVAADSFIKLIVNKQIQNQGNHDGFMGCMLAYEFINQDSDLTKRRKGEKVSLGHLRNQLDSSKNDLIREVDDFKESFTDWDNSTKEKWAEWLGEVSNNHEKQHEDHETQFSEYLKKCKDKISDLEHTYQEKLRLEKPATYWKNSARKYGIQGGLWSLALIAAIVLGITYFYDFFNSWLKGKELGVELNTLHGVILIGSVLTVYAYLIKTLSKLTFSSFHLMRDSEEREQLTYLYLSLIESNSIDESSRDIVLQALFSRSETGLLNTDSSPTMPGVAELLKSTMKS
ncbi:DUF6161 domain-containing protein, partial [Endozoicomonas sp. SESOKO2]|uniref:DUF6161 domain-containing protein n=1 Tax=Endozoicomonas sp. SESOKO2 TaxID=2828743 RepID=UPI0021496FFE